MKTNKEVIDKLQEYFLTQDPKVVCRILANIMIDVRRIHWSHNLPEDELERLVERIKKNSEQLKDFIENGPRGNLTCGPLE